MKSVEEPPARAVAYTHFGAQISAARQVRLLHPLPEFCAGSSTDENSWPTPNRCGFNSQTAHQAGLARRSSRRSITARCWFDPPEFAKFEQKADLEPVEISEAGKRVVAERAKLQHQDGRETPENVEVVHGSYRRGHNHAPYAAFCCTASRHLPSIRHTFFHSPQ